MLKTIDFILYKIIVFFKSKHLSLVWILSFYIVNLSLYYYEISNNLENKLYWYDAVTIIVFISTYIRAKWIIIKLNELKK